MEDTNNQKSSPIDITKRINDLKYELGENYKSLIKIRDSLTNFSFKNIQSNVKNECKINIKEMATKENFDQAMNMFTNDLPQQIDMNDPKSVENVEELNTLLKAIKDLKDGLTKMDSNAIQFEGLGFTIKEEIDCFERKTERIKNQLSKVDGELVAEAIKIYEAGEEEIKKNMEEKLE